MQFEPLPEAVARHCLKLVIPQFNMPDAMLPYLHTPRIENHCGTWACPGPINRIHN